MRSSTSSSEPRYDGGPAVRASSLRAIPPAPWPRTIALAALICLVALGGWEAYWRAAQFTPSVRNSDGLWAMTRARIEREGPGGTAIVGSSRVQFDLNLEAWRDETGQLPIQLALEGTNPRPFLKDIAQTSDFSGLLVVGVTSVLFFPPDAGLRSAALDDYRNETPSEWLSQRLSMALIEPILAFYDPDTALFTVLRRQAAWPLRAGMDPVVPTVRKLANMRRTRQSDLWEKVALDPAYNQVVKDTWLALLNAPRPPPPPPEEASKLFDALLAEVAADVQRIRDRGGEVVFVRAPSAGPFLAIENKAFPRERTWDALLQRTGTVGIHFEDHLDLQDVEIPEWSHIRARDTDRFTRALIRHLRAALTERGTPRKELGP